MTAITVTALTRDDIGEFVDSVAGLFREDAGQHDNVMNVDWPAIEGADNYGNLIGDPGWLLILARDRDRVVGHLVGKLTGPSSFLTVCIAVLESIRVAPEARRSGVGSLLVQRFLSWARESGARQASVTAFAANDTARRFYARHGFTPKTITSRVTL
jgi:GNAT superfamily N-acetyltransferase